MKGDKIPNGDHISRLCFRKYVSPSDGQVQATAFMLGGHKGLSANWMESLNCADRANEIDELRNIYNRKFDNLKNRDKIAVLNVGHVKETVLSESQDRRNLEILHNPTKGDPSHSEIFNLRQNDEEIAEIILETVLEIYPVREE